MTPVSPVTRRGDTVEFSDGTTMVVFDLAREWADWQATLHGNTCMNPECRNEATNNAVLFGHHVGRLCDPCLLGFTP